MSEHDEISCKMQDIPATIFFYDENTYIKETTISGETDNCISPGERPVAAALNKYGFMNKNLIQKNLSINGHKRLNAEKILKKMQKQGKIKKYTIYHGGSALADLDTYTLNEECGQINESDQVYYKINTLDIPYILENMALCQWHYGLLSDTTRCKEIMYNQIKSCSQGFVVIPSIVKTKVGKCDVYLCAVPVKRKKDTNSLRHFVIKLILINQYFIENRSKYRSYMIVLLGESINQIEELAKLLSAMKETKDMDVLFTIDMATINDPLKNLYRINRTKNNSEIMLIKI